MVEPQDSREEQKKAKKKCRQAWLTANGFQVTGLHSGTESDHHLRLPSTTTELTEVHGEEQGSGGVSLGTFPLTSCSPFRDGGRTCCLLMC